MIRLFDVQTKSGSSGSEQGPGTGRRPTDGAGVSPVHANGRSIQRNSSSGHHACRTADEFVLLFDCLPLPVPMCHSE
jgi:hypothetical protein